MPRLADFRPLITILLGFFQLSMAQPANEISGRVTDGQNPISKAVIRSSADTNTTLSDSNGNFELMVANNLPSILISIWKEGYYNGTSIVKNSDSKVEIVLIPLPEEDNHSYTWIDPAPNSEGANYHCGDCHQDIYQQWLASGHAKSASDSIFLDTYNGWNASRNPSYQPGYRLDYAYSNGNCSNCVKDDFLADRNSS